jgi:hypothetical protein
MMLYSNYFLMVYLNLQNASFHFGFSLLIWSEAKGLRDPAPISAPSTGNPLCPVLVSSALCNQQAKVFPSHTVDDEVV